MREKCNTLAIIGNGFDMSHGYNTDYRTFTEKTNNLYLDIFRSYCEKENEITTWHLFEENIRILTEKMFLQSMTEECDYDSNRKEVEELKTSFQEIHRLLIEYLKSETSKKMTKNPNIEQYLNSQTIAINFNYTKTAEVYTKHIIYVHGSLEEQDILLGYDYRDEPCLAQYEDMRWSKTICRESLAFRRFINKKLKIAKNHKKYKTLTSSLQTYQHWENSGRGLEEEIKKTIPSYKLIDKFIKVYRKQVIPNIDYGNIQTFVVLGHGIEADKEFLKEIISSCDNLKKVIIYRYNRESDDEFVKKEVFFRPYCDNIQVVKY